MSGAADTFSGESMPWQVKAVGLVGVPSAICDLSRVHVGQWDCAGDAGDEPDAELDPDRHDDALDGPRDQSIAERQHPPSATDDVCE